MAALLFVADPFMEVWVAVMGLMVLVAFATMLFSSPRRGGVHQPRGNPRPPAQAHLVPLPKPKDAARTPDAVPSGIHPGHRSHRYRKDHSMIDFTRWGHTGADRAPGCYLPDAEDRVAQLTHDAAIHGFCAVRPDGTRVDPAKVKPHLPVKRESQEGQVELGVYTVPALIGSPASASLAATTIMHAAGEDGWRATFRSLWRSRGR